MSNSTDMSKFWLDDFSVLYENYNFLKFIPLPNMTRIEQLNAITRLMLYFMIILLICGMSEELIYIPIVAIVLIVLIYNIYVNNSNNRETYDINEGLINIKHDADNFQENKLQIDSMENIVYTPNNNGYGHGSSCGVIDNGNSQIVLTKNGQLVDLEAGYIDSNGSTITGKKYGPYTVDEIIDCERSKYKDCDSNKCDSFASSFGNYIDNSQCNSKKLPNNSIPNCCVNGDTNNLHNNFFIQCREPSLQNPFMNPNIIDYNTDLVEPAACNAEDDEIKDDIKVNFNHNLFRNVDEIWERENSQRQFFTLPNTGIPNNQNEFAQWLYGDMPSGKEGNYRGSLFNPYYEDLRMKR